MSLGQLIFLLQFITYSLRVLTLVPVKHQGPIKNCVNLVDTDPFVRKRVRVYTDPLVCKLGAQILLFVNLVYISPLVCNFGAHWSCFLVTDLYAEFYGFV